MRAESHTLNTESTPHAQCCAVEGCTNEGSYKAPKSVDNIRDYQWLCLEHVQQHNKKWNYFDGMEREEIEEFMHDAVTGHRPTWKREEVANLRGWQTQLEKELDQFLHGASHRRNYEQKPSHRTTNKMRDALALLALEYPVTMDEVKKSYRDLVKKFHPDLNQGNKSFEEKFKQITEAYQYLKSEIKAEG